MHTYHWAVMTVECVNSHKLFAIGHDLYKHKACAINILLEAGYGGLCSEPQTLPNQTSFAIGGPSLFVDLFVSAGPLPLPV